jgi:hypothetical protein
MTGEHRLLLPLCVKAVADTIHRPFFRSPLIWFFSSLMNGSSATKTAWLARHVTCLKART